LLINLGADINIKNGWKENAIIALCNGSCDGRNCIKTAQVLIKAGISLDEKSFGGYTALMYAAHYDHLYIVYLLLINGADITLANDRNVTFLDYVNERPEVSRVYQKAKKTVAKKIYDTISKTNDFNQDMPDVIADIISKY
jgi:ankyrin repeat protein